MSLQQAVDLAAAAPRELPEFLLGERGSRPIFFAADPAMRRELLTIPGVSLAAGGVECTWDTAPIVAEMLDLPAPTPPVEDTLSETEYDSAVARLAGLQHYKDLGLQDVARPYQKEDALFLAFRAYAMLCLPPRAGKTLTALMAATLRGSQRTLIVCPSIVQRVWAREIGKWLKDPAVVIVVGRGANAVRRMCAACLGQRFTPDGAPCEACQVRGRSRGFIPFKIGWAKQTEERDAVGRATYTCRKHENWRRVAAPGLRVRCTQCQSDLVQILREARWVISGFAILVSQRRRAENGRMEIDPSLPGAGPLLGSVAFDLAIADEIHQIRGYTTDARRVGQTQRERFNSIVDPIRVVWGLTATPIFGFIRDLWGQLDAISRGALTSALARTPWIFYRAYCMWHKTEYGWNADGRSTLADKHLPRRLPLFMRVRQRADIAPWLPKKERQVIHIEPEDEISSAPVKGGSKESRFKKLISRAFKAKVEPICENVINELAASEKSVVFTYSLESAKKIYSELGKAIAAKDNRTRMRQVDAEVWLAHGGIDADTRSVMCENFVRHKGAGVFVATIDSMPGGVSLRGATTVHFMEMHWQPAAIVQAENRPYEDGTERLTVIYYIVDGTIDEQLESRLLPKLDNLKIVGDADASDTKQALRGNAKAIEEESLDDILAAMSTPVGGHAEYEDTDEGWD